MSKVVIIECALSLPSDRFFWGDLWEEGDCWVFNACGDEDGMDELPYSNPKTLTSHTDWYFQRRNVFVISKALSELNQEAKDYLGQ